MINYKLQQIIESIKSAADEEKANNNISGIIAYVDCLKIIQEELDEQELKDYRLNFDVEKKYL